MSVCGISRDYCDDQFGKCMKKGCGKDQECISSASMITMGASLFGCEPYLKGQRDDCDCLESSKLESCFYLDSDIHMYSSFALHW